MRKTNFLSLTLAAIIGGLAIHGFLVACSGGTGAGTALAQSAPCQQWAFISVAPAAFADGPMIPTASGSNPASNLVPEGWEPIGPETVRRCVK